MADAIGLDRTAVARWEAGLANAAQAAGPPLLFGLRLWASVCLAIFFAFWLEFPEPNWGGLGAAIASLPVLGASLRKGGFLIIGTVVGAVMVVVLGGFFPQDGLAFLGLLAVWGGICAFGATVLRNFASYAAACAGFTAVLAACASLGEMKEKKAVPVLQQVLDGDIPEVSFAAARALLQMDDPAGEEAVLQVLARQK